VPSFKLLSRTIIPEWSSLIFNSASEQIIPFDSTPRIFAFVNFCPDLGIIAPSNAKTTFCPLATLGAPQITLYSFSPAETLHNDNLSALGCLVFSLT
jgi:hypothetical protein